MRFDPIEWVNGNGKVRYQPRIENEALFLYRSLGQRELEWVNQNYPWGPPKLYRSKRKAIRVARRAARDRAEGTWTPHVTAQ